LPYGESRAQHVLEFEVEEPAPVRRLNAEGLVTPARHPTPIQGRRLALHDALFTDDAMILDAVVSRRVSYGADSGPRLTVEFPDTPYLGLWSKPGAPFVCIEPWHGMADPEGFAGDFIDKPGVFLVAPGAERQLVMRVTLSQP
jgi:galactose mutarotase-like enzyme